MEDDKEIRKSRYKQMSTQELLELHTAGILGDMAYNLLESELRGRGIIVPSRPKGEESLAEADSTENHKGKRSCQYAMLAWISPLIGFILLLVIFLANVAETFIGKAIMFIFVSIVVGAIFTMWAFVERNRYSNALNDAIIGLLVNVAVLFAIVLFFLDFIWKGMSGKFGY